MGDISYRIRNCFTLANSAACTVGAGLAVMGIFTPIAFPNVSQETALIFFYISIGLIVIGLAMAVWRYIKNPIEKKLRVFNIISVLDKMYKRLEQLEDEEKNKEIDWNKFRETSDKITKLVQVTVPKVSSVDEAREAVENLEKGLPGIFPSDVELDQKVRQILSMSRLIDKGGFGLRDKRGKDKKYSKLLKLVDEYYDENKGIIDNELRILIRSCIDFNESAANTLLFKHHINTALTSATSLGVPNILTPSLEADIEGFSDEIRERARMLRIKVGECIKKLVKGHGN